MTGRAATRRAAVLLVSVLALARAADARADAPAPSPTQLQAARDLFTQAERDEDSGRWADALERLRRVADVKLTAGVRYHIALCEENLGRSATALAHYTEARDAAIRERSQEVLALVKPAFLASLRARVATLTIDVPRDVEGAAVTVDGQSQPQGLWGVAVPIDPGMHRVEASAPGRLSFRKDLAVSERDVIALDVALPPEGAAPSPGVITVTTSPASAAAPGRQATSAPRGAAPPALGPDASAAPGRQPARSPSLAAPLLVTAGAVVLVGGGIAAYLVAGSAQDDARAQCRTQPTCDDLRGPVRAWDTVALSAWIGAAALATTAVILWTAPSRTARDASRAVRVEAGVGQLRLTGSF